jgi:DNA-binding transcriptional LysR family regulator
MSETVSRWSRYGLRGVLVILLILGFIRNRGLSKLLGKAGEGIALASRWMCRAELEAGELVAILSNFQLDWVELHAVYAVGPRPSLKVRAFSDYLAAQLTDKMKAPEGG